MSVQSGRTYEQEFALEIAKAKVRPRRGCPLVAAAVLCKTRLQNDEGSQRRVCSTQEGKVKNTPWGSSFRAPQQILHGKLPVEQAHANPFVLNTGSQTLLYSTQASLSGLLVPTSAGYDKAITGKTAHERLDIRCAVKTDKFCK